MTPSQIEQSWKKGHADAVYFFYGEEEFLRDELIRKSIDLLLPDVALRSFNLEVFDGAESKLHHIFAAAKSYPVMAEVRLVICRNTEKFFTARSDERKQEENEMVASYLEDPNRSTILILDSSKPGAKNTYPWKSLHANAAVVEFAPLKEGAAIEWICERAERYGKHLETRAAQVLVTLLGSDLRALSSELEKLVSYVGAADAITLVDVETTIGVSPTYNIFELTKAIGAGNKPKASEIAQKMVEADKGERFVMMMMLSRYFEQLSIAKELVGKASDQAIAKALDLYGGGAYFVKDYIGAARRYSREQLDNATKAIVSAEHQTRRAKIDDKLLVQKLIAEVVV
ncbi:MAG TPA: DNA polymerase III subunit delta [Candidatus Kapabacteria bacterium]|nr:DNA polymerase III subunit delta [Candidatus Kapabacteria bacterium]